MKTFAAATRVRAEPSVVWRLLTDAPNYPSWNPTVERIEGRIVLGEKIKVFARPYGSAPRPVERSKKSGKGRGHTRETVDLGHSERRQRVPSVP
jgi:hypothetical protein